MSKRTLILLLCLAATLGVVGLVAGASAPPPLPYVVSATAANCEAITNASVQRTMTRGSLYQFCAYGQDTYVMCAANPTATTIVTTGFVFIVPADQCRGPYRVDVAKCAIIGASTSGNFCYLTLSSP
jgi:hypothetical protein